MADPSIAPPVAAATQASATGPAALGSWLDPSQPPALWLGLTVALGLGLLIGLERERSKGRGIGRAAAGVRTFTLAAVAGALAQGLAQRLDQPALVALGALAVLLLAVLAYAYSLRLGPSQAARAGADPATEPPLDHPDNHRNASDRANAGRTPAARHAAPRHRRRSAGAVDPGMTTELALVVTYLLGVLAMVEPGLAATGGVGVAALLAARSRLHRFATRVLTEDELHDGLLLAALALVLLPLLPSEPVAWLAGLQPRPVATLVVLILVLQTAGHVALRVAGARAGLAISGLMSGFVSSSATVAAMGARARREPAEAPACTAGAMLSTSATWVQALLMLLTIAPVMAGRLWPALAVGALVAAGLGGLKAWRMTASAANLAAAGEPPHRPSGGPLRVREAMAVATLLTGVTWLVSFASHALGEGGALASAVLAALADAHSSVAALGALAAQGRLPADQAGWGIMAAIAANSVSRTAIAAISGGRHHLQGVGAALWLGWMAAAAVAVLSGAMVAPQDPPH